MSEDSHLQALYGLCMDMKHERFLTCTADGGEPMCNDEYSTPSHDALQGLLYQMLTLCIQCTVIYKAYCIMAAQLACQDCLSARTDSWNSPCCLIQEQDSWILKQRHRKSPSSQSWGVESVNTTLTLQYLHSYSWCGLSKATIHCRKLCVDTMNYIQCTCSTNKWLSHSLKIFADKKVGQEDHTYDLWSVQGQLNFGPEVRFPVAEEISLYPEASYPQWVQLPVIKPPQPDIEPSSRLRIYGDLPSYFLYGFIVLWFKYKHSLIEDPCKACKPKTRKVI
jgi:hypothetical protein